jgi:hypothetical protein
MKTETAKPQLPENLTITVLSHHMDKEDGRPVHKFRLQLKNNANGQLMSFDYSGGIHAFLPKPKEDPTGEKPPHVFDAKAWAKSKKADAARALTSGIRVPGGQLLKAWGWQDWQVRSGTPSGAIREAEEWIAANYEVDPCGVVYSLLSDSDSGNQSFRSFCDEFGYNSDSIKDRGIWEACQEIGEDFLRVVGREQIETLRELLQDY